LAEASYPYGIEAFDSVLIPLWEGIHHHRGKGLAAFLKAIGFIIPLMDTEHAFEYVQEVMPTLKREFANNDEETKKVVLMVIKQCVSCPSVTSQYVRTEVIPDYFKYYWVKKMALERRNYR